jgi:hypothetical protein
MGRPKKVVSLGMDNQEVELKEVTVLENDTEVEKEEEVVVVPEMHEAAWTDYVLSQLFPDELSDKCPTVEGLRRISQVLLGPIVDSSPQDLVLNNEETAVSYKVTFLWQRNDPRFGMEVSFGSCADTTDTNANHPYNKYKAAMSDTRAEGRALKKALGLKRVLTAEEANPELELPSKDTVTSGQLAAIKNLCKKQDINVNKFVEMFCLEIGADVPATVEQLTKGVAVQACQRLNDYNVDVKNNDHKLIPQDIKGH